MTWQETNIETGQRMIDFARSQMPPGAIGAVPLAATCDLGDIPLEMLGDRPPSHRDADRHRRYEEDFLGLVDLEVRAGTVSQDVGDLALSNFHIYMVGNRATLPRVY